MTKYDLAHEIYQLNYKSFATRCQNKVIMNFLNEVLKSIQDLPSKMKVFIKVSDDMESIDVAQINDEFEGRLRIQFSGVNFDLKDEDIVVKTAA